MGEFSDRREPHRRETPKSVLELHSNSWLIHDLCEHWGNSKEKQRQDRRSNGTKISDAAHYQRVKSMGSKSSQVKCFPEQESALF